MTAIAPHIRFRQARERAGLSPGDVAAQCSVHSANVWDIESVDGELTSCYSAREVQEFFRVLGIRPIDLFADSISEPPISADELVQLTYAECRARGVTLKQLEDTIGWRLTDCIEPPEKLLKDMYVDGLRWLCDELRIDWRRVLLSL